MRLSSAEADNGYVNIQLFKQATIPQSSSSDFKAEAFDHNVYEDSRQKSESSEEHANHPKWRQLHATEVFNEVSRKQKTNSAKLSSEIFLNFDEIPQTALSNPPIKIKEEGSQNMSLKQLLACDKPLTLTSRVNVFQEEPLEVNEIDYTTEENRQIKKVHKSLGKFLGLDLGSNAGMLENFLSFAGIEEKP